MATETKKEVKIVLFSSRIEMMLWGIIIALAIGAFVITIDLLATKQEAKDAKLQSIENREAIINGTKQLFDKGNQRGNQTIAYFDNKITQLLANDQIKFSKLDNLSKEIHHDVDSIMAFEKNSTASKFQGERNYQALLHLLNVTLTNQQLLNKSR